jgi:hypothetical protein
VLVYACERGLLLDLRNADIARPPVIRRQARLADEIFVNSQTLITSPQHVSRVVRGYECRPFAGDLGG